MYDTRKALFASLALTVVFDRLFWHQSIGINLSLFALLGAGTLVWQERGRLSPAACWTAVGVLVSAAMLVVHGSVIACVALCASLVAFTGFVHAVALRTHGMAVMQALADTLTVPVAWIGLVQELMGRRKALSATWRWGRLLVVPVGVLFVYILLYRGGNSRFNAMTAGVMDDLGELFERFLDGVVTPHTVFLLFGLVVCGGLLVRYTGDHLAQLEGRSPDVLRRVRLRRVHWKSPLAMGALDRERRMGVVLLVGVNALLLVVNAVDIHWLWGGFTVPEHFNLKEFVHEGTWLLIVSILLSIGILLLLFRRNLNFHPKARLLRVLAFVWLVQNFILGISVFLRNYHYIAFHGLAYLRIGVVVFLLLVLVGLVTLAIKVHQRKSLFFLFRVNGWAAFAALIALSTVDWDSTITRYNLHHWNSGEIDIDNYLAMSDKVLPLLYADLPLVEQQMAKHRGNAVRWVDHLDPAAFRMELDRRRARFLGRYVRREWPSWTWADQRTFDALAQVPPDVPPPAPPVEEEPARVVDPLNP